MIIAITERRTIVTCADCGRFAYLHEAVVRHPGVEYRVPYETHAESLHHGDHREALERLDKFFESAAALESELRELSEDRRRLEYGSIAQIDIDTVRPSACAQRTHIIPEATVRAFHQERSVRASSRLLHGSTAETILDDLKAAAAPVIATMKSRFDRGEF